MEFSLVYEKPMPLKVKGQHDGVLSSVAFERYNLSVKTLALSAVHA